MTLRSVISLLTLLALVPACNAGPTTPATPGMTPQTATHTHARAASATNADGVTVTGSIYAMISGGFTLQAGAGKGYVHIYTNAQTTISGPAPAAGMSGVSVTGTGSLATSITATSVTTGQVITAPPNTFTLTGPITNLVGGGFTMNASYPVGYIHIYTGTSTTQNGGTAKTGLYARATGTGSKSTSMNATYVTFSSAQPASIDASGVVAAATSYGFTLDAGSSYPAVPVVLDASTIIGGASLVPGASVQITGTGAVASSINAVQIIVSAPTPAPGSSPSPTPSPIAVKHALTADYLGGLYGTTSIAWSAATPYLSWAQTSIADANAISAAGMKTQLYIDPNRTEPGDPLYTSDESTFAHDCSGNRVTDTYGGATQDVMNPGSSTMQSLFATYVSDSAGTAHFDSLYEDDAGPLSGFAAYEPFSAMPCDYTDALWLTESEALNQRASVPIVFNGLSGLNGEAPSLSIGLLGSSNTIGGNYEHCYTDDGQAKMDGWLWQTIENTELQVLATNKAFWCQARNSGAAASETDARLYAYASFLLTYNPASSILWEEFATASGLHVMPETALVPMDPLVAAPAAISGLLVSGGTYGREFAHCFISGTFAGPCAVVVNPDPSLSHAFPYPQYRHTLVLSGSGVLEGGTISTTGPAPPLDLAPEESAIVFP